MTVLCSHRPTTHTAAATLDFAENPTSTRTFPDGGAVQLPVVMFVESHAAIDAAGPVVPVFVMDVWLPGAYWVAARILPAVTGMSAVAIVTPASVTICPALVYSDKSCACTSKPP